MTEREQVLLHNSDPAELLADVVGQIATRTSPKSIEISYDRVGTPLGDGEEPGPGDSVRWVCTAVYRRRNKMPEYERSGEHVVAPGEDHGRGGLLAAVALLEKLGANVVFLDMSGARP